MTPDEALAREVVDDGRLDWSYGRQPDHDLLVELIAAALTRAEQAAYERAAKLCEDHGHSNGRIRGSHKHLAAAIRALAAPSGREGTNG